MLRIDMTARRLAAILAADVVGYSRMMGEDEAGTAKSVRDSRAAAGPIIAAHGRRMFKTMGDGFLVEFPSMVSAVECALALQANGAAERGRGGGQTSSLPDGDPSRRCARRGGRSRRRRRQYRGAARGVTAPGGVFISRTAYETVVGQLEARLTDLGEKALKNIARPVRVYTVAARAGRRGRRTASARGGEEQASSSFAGRASVRQSRRRPGAGIFRRRGHR
jgi:adenylate cyclase